MNENSGTYEPFVSVFGRGYTREECNAIYLRANNGERLTREEAAVVGAWLVHPLNTNLEQAPYAIGVFLRNRDHILRAIVARVEDVDVIAKILYRNDPLPTDEIMEYYDWEDLSENIQNHFRNSARAVRDYLLKGEG